MSRVVERGVAERPRAATAAPNRALVDALRTSFAAHADAANAAPMQAYMKSALPFHGIAAPQRRALQAAAVKRHPCKEPAELAATMMLLWRAASHREERYAAAELARMSAHRRLLDASLLPVCESMIAEGAWWDLCDEISGQTLPILLQRHPEVVKPLLRRWANGDDVWLRRAAILAQRRLGAGCDPVLIYETILPSIGSSPLAGEFFLRKGIGWALRERAYHAPDEVRAFCREYAAMLAPLTLREALRRIGP